MVADSPIGSAGVPFENAPVQWRLWSSTSLVATPLAGR